jgi:hypothetical protein
MPANRATSAPALNTSPSPRSTSARSPSAASTWSTTATRSQISCWPIKFSGGLASVTVPSAPSRVNRTLGSTLITGSFPGRRGLQSLSQLTAYRGEQVDVGVRVSPQSPAAVGRLGQQYPDPLGCGWVTGRAGDQFGEAGHHGDLLAAIQRAGVGQHLHAHVIGTAVDVGDRVGGKFVNEDSGVLTEHRNIGHFLNHHQRSRQAACQQVLVLERTSGRVHVDHRHRVTPP